MQRYLQSTTFPAPGSLDKPRGPGADCPPGKTENLYSLANIGGSFFRLVSAARRVRRAHYSDFIAAIKSYRLARKMMAAPAPRSTSWHNCWFVRVLTIFGATGDLARLSHSSAQLFVESRSKLRYVSWEIAVRVRTSLWKINFTRARSMDKERSHGIYFRFPRNFTAEWKAVEVKNQSISTIVSKNGIIVSTF